MTKTGMPIRPIRTEQDHKTAIKRIESLFDAPPGSAAADDLEVLVTLADAYETQKHAIDLPDPVSAILFRMDQLQLTRKEMEPYLGSRARVSEILNGRRALSLKMIRALSTRLHIPAELLIHETSPRRFVKHAVPKRVAATRTTGASATARGTKQNVRAS